MQMSGLIHAPDALLPMNALCTHCRGECVGPRAGTDALKKGKSIALAKMGEIYGNY
jgi:hypothetical protein